MRMRSKIVVIVVIAVLSGCGLVPRWSPRVEGRLFDARTGDPIEGAEIFAGYLFVSFNTAVPYDVRWTTTDVDGRFAIPGHLRGPSPSILAKISSLPHFNVLHPEYGYFQFHFDTEYLYGFPALEFPGYRNLEFRIEPSELELQIATTPDFYLRMCPSRDRDLCVRACEVAYGSLEPCFEAGLARE